MNYLNKRGGEIGSPLPSARSARFAFNFISCKEHLTKDGLAKLVAIKASLNLGLPEKLKQAGGDRITPCQARAARASLFLILNQFQDL